MNGIGEATVFGRIEFAVQGRLNALPAERYADDVHAFRGEMIDRLRLWVEIILIGDAG